MPECIKLIMFKYQFEDKYPRADKLGLFSKRKEISHLLIGKSYRPLIAEIEKAFPGSESKDEIIVTTYFESVYAFEPKNTCVARFRQRVSSRLLRNNGLNQCGIHLK